MLATGLGVALGVVAYYLVPGIIPADNVIVAIIIGGASGLTATGVNQIIKQLGNGGKGKGNRDRIRVRDYNQRNRRIKKDRLRK